MQEAQGRGLGTFAEDPKTLVDKAYLELQDDLLALTHYLRQLEEQQLAFSVKQRRPKSVDAAVSAMLEMELYGMCHSNVPLNARCRSYGMPVPVPVERPCPYLSNACLCSSRTPVPVDIVSMTRAKGRPFW